MLLTINPENPQARLINEAVKLMKQGAVICYPTDTMYGIGCDIYNQKAIKRIYQIKRRPKQKPFSFMCSSLKNVSEYGYLSNTAYRVMKKLLPGPYTFIVPALKIVPKILITKQKTVGIRVPDCNIATALVDALGNPVLNTSATLDDEMVSMTHPFELEELLGKLVDVIIDGGPLFPTPSSVIDLVGDTPEVLRHGKGDTSLFDNP